MSADSIERGIDLATRIIVAHRYARRLTGSAYPERVKPWIELVDAASMKHNCGPIQALLKLNEVSNQIRRPLSDGDLMWLCAAVHEIATREEHDAR